MLARPQLITPPIQGQQDPAPSDVRVIATVYFDGLTTSLKPSDRLLFSFGDDPGQQTLRTVRDVVPQPPASRTLVTLVGDASYSLFSTPALFWKAQTRVLFPGSNIADAVYALLGQIQANADQALTDPAELVTGAISGVSQQRDIAAARGFSRLTAFLFALLQVMQAGGGFVSSNMGGSGGGGVLTLKLPPATLAAFPLANLAAAAAGLALPRSVQPANPQHLAASVATSFAPRSDVAPRLIAAFIAVTEAAGRRSSQKSRKCCSWRR